MHLRNYYRQTLVSLFMAIEVHYMSERQDWGTPPAFLEWLKEKFNWVPDLDAAASPHNAKASAYYTAEDNSLEQSWSGNVWLNPPFGGELPKFLKKCADEIKRPEVESIVALVPARTDTKWFHEIVCRTATEVILIKGRFNFVQPDVSAPGANAPFPSMLVYWSNDQSGGVTFDTMEPSTTVRGFK
jgi:phage N-6-adenine-methyltransferase